MKVESKRKRERKGKKKKGFSNLNNNKRESVREKDVKTKIQTKMH